MLVNVAGAGVLERDHTEAAERFVEFLLSEGQQFYVDEAEETEYPLVAGIDAKAGLSAEELHRPIELTAFGAELSRRSSCSERPAAHVVGPPAGARPSHSRSALAVSRSSCCRSPT